MEAYIKLIEKKLAIAIEELTEISRKPHNEDCSFFLFVMTCPGVIATF